MSPLIKTLLRILIFIIHIHGLHSSYVFSFYLNSSHILGHLGEGILQTLMPLFHIWPEMDMNLNLRCVAINSGELDTITKYKMSHKEILIIEHY